MRKAILLSFIFILNIAASYGQVTEEQNYMSAGTFNSMTIAVPLGGAEAAPKEWGKFLKPYGKTRRDRKTDEYLIEEANIPAISNNPVRVFAKFNGNSMTVWFDLGEAYLSSTEHEQEYKFAEKLLLDFELHLKVLVVEDELEKEEKSLETLQDEHEKLLSNKSDLEEDILEWKAKIAQAEADIEQNLLDQEAKLTKIEAQKLVIEEVKARLTALKVQ